MADFEVHPVGTAKRLQGNLIAHEINIEFGFRCCEKGMNLERTLLEYRKLFCDCEQDPIEVNSPSAIPEDQAPDEDLPMMLKPQAD